MQYTINRLSLGSWVGIDELQEACVSRLDGVLLVVRLSACTTFGAMANVRRSRFGLLDQDLDDHCVADRTLCGPIPALVASLTVWQFILTYRSHIAPLSRYHGDGGHACGLFGQRLTDLVQ